jgi:hypothetical protein
VTLKGVDHEDQSAYSGANRDGAPPGAGGAPVEEICRKRCISEPTFYRWKERFGSLGVPEVQELR